MTIIHSISNLIVFTTDSLVLFGDMATSSHRVKQPVNCENWYAI